MKCLIFSVLMIVLAVTNVAFGFVKFDVKYSCDCGCGKDDDVKKEPVVVDHD